MNKFWRERKINMELVLGTILLLAAVIAANVVHLIYPRIPLAIYQIVAGILLASLPTSATNFTMHPELFMMVVIAPLMFNDGQNQSFRYLSKNTRAIFSIAIMLALVTVIVTGCLLHLAMPKVFPLALAFTLAAIITPTDAVAVKSLTTNVTMPENVSGALEYESLFNDASGIVLLDLALTAYQSGKFSLGHGLWIFAYVFFGGIIFGAVLGTILIKLRTRLMRNHVDIGSIVIPINVMTPLVVYWLAEELHFSGILAVVAAGIVHSILYDRLRLTSTKVQIATTTIWTIISDALNGLVFVLLGVLLPQVLRRTSLLSLTKLIVIALLFYLVMTAMRFVWVRWRLVRIGSTPESLSKDTLLMAIGGIHGTITLSLAFSLPVAINDHTFVFRNSIILIAAIVILISILVGAVAYPLLLPAKAKSFTEEEFHHQLTATVQYAINQLNDRSTAHREKAVVIDQLSTQLNLYHQLDQQRYQQLMTAAHQVELDTVDQLNADGVITDREANFYARFISHAVFRHSQHGFWEYFRLLWHRIKWRHFQRRHLQHHLDQNPQLKQAVQDQMAAAKQNRQSIQRILKITSKKVNQYLQSVETPENANEVALVRRAYLQQRELFSRGQELDGDTVNSLFIDAFQYEHSYVQERQAAGKLKPELANALNEQISTDELVYVQSLD